MSTTADLAAPLDAEPVVLGGDAPPAKRAWSVAPLLLRLHFYAGILVAPFLVVSALTGLAFVFTPQLDEIVYADEFTVAQVGAAPRPLAEQVAAAVAAHPEGTVGSVIPPAAEDATTRVVFYVDGLGEKQHTVFVDPYTSEVRGTLVTWWGETPLMTWFDDLHRNLLLDVAGRHYSELAASWLWVIVLGGLVLWLRRQRGGSRKLRNTVLPDLSARKGVRRTRGWHAATGVWLAIGLLILSATGLTWSRYAGLPAWAIVVGGPLAVGIGWAMPMFGVSLVAFLVVDLIVGAVLRKRRSRAVVPTSPAPAGSRDSPTG